MLQFADYEYIDEQVFHKPNKKKSLFEFDDFKVDRRNFSLK